MAPDNNCSSIFIIYFYIIVEFVDLYLRYQRKEETTSIRLSVRTWWNPENQSGAKCSDFTRNRYPQVKPYVFYTTQFLPSKHQESGLLLHYLFIQSDTESVQNASFNIKSPVRVTYISSLSTEWSFSMKIAYEGFTCVICFATRFSYRQFRSLIPLT